MCKTDREVELEAALSYAIDIIQDLNSLLGDLAESSEDEDANAAVEEQLDYLRENLS